MYGAAADIDEAAEESDFDPDDGNDTPDRLISPRI